MRAIVAARRSRASPARPWCGRPTRCCRRSPRTSRITVGAASIVITAYALTHGSMQLVIGPIADRFGKYRTVAMACALSARHGGAVRDWRSRSGADAGALCLRRHGRPGSCRSAIAYIGDVVPYDQPPAVARPLSSPGRFSASCSARRPAASSATTSAGATCSSCWRRCSRVAAVGAEHRARDQSASPRAGSRSDRARLRRCDYTIVLSQPVGADHLLVVVPRRRAVPGRLRLRRRRPASALRAELHRHRPHRRHIRDRRADLCGDGAAADAAARPDAASPTAAAR